MIKKETTSNLHPFSWTDIKIVSNFWGAVHSGRLFLFYKNSHNILIDVTAILHLKYKL